jgi:hypothetical protein
VLYRVTIFRPSQYERCFEAKEHWTCGNVKTAKLSALEKLPVSNETYYSAKVSRLPYAVITKAKGKAEQGTFIDTPVNYVPSVGDLGYTP